MLVFGIILLFLLLLGFTRFGVRAACAADGRIRLVLRAGPVRVNLLKRAGRKKAKVAKPKKKRRSLPVKAKNIPGIAGAALRSLRKGARVDRLTFKLTVAGAEDPCDAAIMYGRAHMALGVLLPVLDKHLRIKKRRTEIKLDFGREKTEWEGNVAVTISLGRLIAVILSVTAAYFKQTNRKKIPGKAV